jgi:recombination protein RecT
MSNAVQTTANPTHISDYLRKPEVMARFADLLGNREAEAYVQSVLIAVSASPDLMQCTNASIFRSALRAASLGLSCDPALKQAWLVPYNKKIRDRDGNEKWVKEAQFQPHYRGLYTLAMRTGKYWQINVSPVYEGQRVLENPLTGLHAVQDGNVVGQPDSYNPAYVDVTVRRRKDQKIIGWLGYFRTKKGFEKSVWMSAAEIDDHARKYVKDYAKNPNWSDQEKRQTMEMKTVLRQLLSWADLSGSENAALAEAMQSEIVEPIDAETEEVAGTDDNGEGMSYEIARSIVVKVGKGEKFIAELDAQALNDLLESESATDEQKEAARVVLKSDFNMESPEQPQRSEDQIKKELGF